MASQSYKQIWIDIMAGAGGDEAAICAAIDVHSCFMMHLAVRDWTRARACCDAMQTAEELTADQCTYVKSKIPS